MYKKSLFLILLLNCISIYSQRNNISVEQVYKKLTHNQLTYIQFSDSFTLTEGSQKKGKQQADFLLLSISKTEQLKFKKFTYNNPTPPFYFRDSIFLYNKKYCIDNIFYGKKTLKKEEPLRLNYASGYNFSLNSRDYISLFFWDATIPTSNLSYYIILFDVSNQKSIKYYFFDEQMSFTPDCFGDFNNDGVLDFANWTYGKSLKFMTLSANKFKNLKNKFIVFKETTDRTYLIEWEKSNWFKKK